MKKQIQRFLIILGATLSLIVAAIGIVQFNDSVNTELETLLEARLSDTAIQQQSAFNNELEDGRALLRHISKALPFLGYDETAILEFLSTLNDEFEFENLMLIEMHGRGMLADGSHADISDMDYFHSASNGDVVTTEPYVSKYSGNKVIAIAAPIHFEGEVAGVIAAEYSVTYLSESLGLTLKDGQGYAMVVNSQGDVLISTNENYTTINDLTQSQSVSRPVEDVLGDLAAGRIGTLRFTNGTVEQLVEYRPLEINGWSLVFIATATDVAAGVAAISNNMLILSVALICLAALIALYLLRKRRDTLQRVERLAYYDELTDISNMVKFKLDAAALMAKHPEKQFIMLMMDIVNFKGINEVFGFEMGDKVLKTIADNGKTVPEPTFTHARVGTDEFMMFSSGGLFEDMPTTTAFYEQQFKRMLPELEKHQFSFRYGRYVIEQGNTDINDIVNKTIIAHSFAKVEGGINIWDYDNKFKQKVLRMTEIANKMEDALKKGDFKVYLQPKYRIIDSTIVGAEALVRWIEDDGSTVYPDEFIPLFENNGFIVKLDMSMLDNVCLILKQWLDLGEPCVPISVNFSRVHLRNKNFVDDIKTLVQKHGVPHNYIEVELTETTVTENEKELKALLDDLHAAGFRVAIDDFGSGYSSLGMLKNFRVDTLKLDKSFFNHETADERGDIVVGGITKLARNLYMHTVAEGIEYSSQVELLKKVNCDIAQGYYYAKPMTVSEFKDLLLLEAEQAESSSQESQDSE